MVILGLNSAYHEPAAALLVDGQIVAAAEEERFSRIKHGKCARPNNADELPWRAIEFCLNQAGIRFADVNAVGYSLDPWARRNAKWHDSQDAAQGDFGTAEGEEAFFQSQLRVRAALAERNSAAVFHFLPHHLCHAASAYYVSPYRDAAILVVDGIGEFASVWAGIGTDSVISTIFEVDYPHSLGFLWEKVSEYLGFDRYDGPGKVMALGAANNHKSARTGVDYLQCFHDFVRIGTNGLFEVDPAALRYRQNGFEGLERKLGPRKRATTEYEETCAIAAGLQLTTERVLAYLARELWARTRRPREPQLDALCMAGGVALNCVANARLAQAAPWKHIWVQPAANDAGTALGAALLIWHQILGRTQRLAFTDAFLGPAYSERDYMNAISTAQLNFRKSQNAAVEAARMIRNGKILAWFQGRMEFGPRALGNRSIIADPRNKNIASVINQRIKAREEFRPFAPSIAADAIDRYLVSPLPPRSDSSDPLEYMLMAAPIRAAATRELPGVVHVNRHSGESSSRVHSLQAGRNPLYEELVAACHTDLGVPAVLNTSFNVREPIVCSPADACATFVRSGLDALVLGPFIVERS